jgi:addiction module RelE/StbE family toxin
VIIRWTPTALHDLQSAHDYVASDKPDAAADIAEHLLEAIDALARHPHMGRKGRVAGTRELIVRPYVIVYRVRADAIELVAILHTARRWPDSFQS